MSETTVDESTDEVPAVGAVPAEPTGPAEPETASPEPDEDPRTLHRVSWATTSGAFLVAVVILLARGDYGYAVVTFAVALAAAINLL